MIGLSTYAYLWQCSENSPRALGVEDMLRDTADLGGQVFQICDYPSVERYDAGRLAGIRDLAADLGIALELGTRGVRRGHLSRYLQLAEALGAGFIRSMIQPDDTPPREAREELSAVLPDFGSAGVRLGLETYEQIRTVDLLAHVRALDHDALGIVLDPGNSVAALESPADVVAQTAPWVNNLHIKDFAFSRQPGWVGFSFSGARLGEGLLDYDGMIDAVGPRERGIHQIVEHWLPWQGDIHRTVQVEREWTAHSINYLRSKNA